ncbi:MAG: hypothetical protein Q8P32_04170 [Candidatus Komeilibacteria bacterium]|nr:hypothetical protein [Candidatus Komeilibacteria bacterium]
MKKFTYSLGLAVFAIFLVAGLVQAASTIGTNISTGGTLAVTGASTLTGATTITGLLTANGDITLSAGATVVNTSATLLTVTETNVNFAASKLGVATSSPASTFSVNTAAGVNPFAVASSTGTYLMVNKSGNVGIGTNNPTTKLYVSGAATFTGNLTVDTNTLFVNAATNRVGVASSTPQATFSVGDGASTTMDMGKMCFQGNSEDGTRYHFSISNAGVINVAAGNCP